MCSMILMQRRPKLSFSKVTYRGGYKMQTSTDHDKDDVGQLPAFGPKFGPAIAQAALQLEKLAVRRDFNHEGWPENAKLWRELLVQSRDRSSRDMAPYVLKGDLAAPTAVKLSGRRWQAFLRWFERIIAPELRMLSLESGIPALKAVRQSNPKGGRPEQSEAVYFLAFVDPQATLTSLPGAKIKAANLKQLESSGLWGKLIFRYMGKSVRNEPRSIKGDVAVQRRWQFGIATALFGIFLLIFCIFLPVDLRRGMLVGYAVILFIVGAWDMDEANKGNARYAFLPSSEEFKE